MRRSYLNYYILTNLTKEQITTKLNIKLYKNK